MIVYGGYNVTRSEHLDCLQRGKRVEDYAKTFYPESVPSYDQFSYYDFRVGNATINVKTTRSDRWRIEDTGKPLADWYLLYTDLTWPPKLENILSSQEVERIPLVYDRLSGKYRRYIFRRNKEKEK